MSFNKATYTTQPRVPRQTSLDDIQEKIDWMLNRFLELYPRKPRDPETIIDVQVFASTEEQKQITQTMRRKYGRRLDFKIRFTQRWSNGLKHHKPLVEVSAKVKQRTKIRD